MSTEKNKISETSSQDTQSQSMDITDAPRAVSFAPERKSNTNQAKKLEVLKRYEAYLQAKNKSADSFEVLEMPAPEQTSVNGGKDEDISKDWQDHTEWLEGLDAVEVDELLLLEWEQFKMKMDRGGELKKPKARTGRKRK